MTAMFKNSSNLSRRFDQIAAEVAVFKATAGKRDDSFDAKFEKLLDQRDLSSMRLSARRPPDWPTSF